MWNAKAMQWCHPWVKHPTNQLGSWFLEKRPVWKLQKSRWLQDSFRVIYFLSFFFCKLHLNRDNILMLGSLAKDLMMTAKHEKFHQCMPCATYLFRMPKLGRKRRRLWRVLPEEFLFTNLWPMNRLPMFLKSRVNLNQQNSFRSKSTGEWNCTVWTARSKLEHLCHVHEADYVQTTFSGDQYAQHMYSPTFTPHALCLQSLKIVLSAAWFGPLPCTLCAGCRLSTAKD